MNQHSSADTLNRVQLERQMQNTRHASLIAMRQGDYDKVARLTNAAARLSRQLSELYESSGPLLEENLVSIGGRGRGRG